MENATGPNPAPPAQPKSFGQLFRTAFIAFIPLMMLVFVCGRITDWGSPPAPSKPLASEPPPAPRDPEGIRAREKFAKDLVKDKLVYKIAMEGALPVVYVMPRFGLMMIDEKRVLMAMLYEHFVDRGDGNGMFELRDARTGKTVGNYYHRSGLKLEDD